MTVKPAVGELRDKVERLREDLKQTQTKLTQVERRAEVLEGERDEWRMDWESLSAKVLNARDEVNWCFTRVILQRNLARQSRDIKENELVFLRKELTRAKMDASIYEGMYDTKRPECDNLLVKLEQAKIFGALGDDLHEERHAYVTKLEKRLTDIREAVDWLWGLWADDSLRSVPGFEDDVRKAWGRLLAAVDI